MRIALVHNYYQQPGGEDQVFVAETLLLKKHGHYVYNYTIHNDSVSQYSKTALTKNTFWNSDTFEELRTILRQEQIQVMHVHNTFPLLSPSIYYAAKAEGVAVVQTLHNYRLLCPSATLFRADRVCEACVGRAPWPGVIHACYRESHVASSVVAAMLMYHRASHTWEAMVDVYVALTDFMKAKFVQGGLPEAKIVVKPNFLNAVPITPGEIENYALFVGRLSEEKGLSVLISAWRNLGSRIPLKIVGDGPLAMHVEGAVDSTRGIEWLGWQPRDRVLELMRHANMLIFPSLWYEGLPLTILEAFAMGLPVLASNLGSMTSLIEHQRTGLHFEPGDAVALEAQVNWALMHPAELILIRKAARAEFEGKYTAEANYPQLMQIYERALALN